MAFTTIADHVQAFALKSPAIFSVAVIVSLVGLIRYILTLRSPRLNFPVVGTATSAEMKSDMIEAASKVY